MKRKGWEREWSRKEHFYQDEMSKNILNAFFGLLYKKNIRTPITCSWFDMITNIDISFAFAVAVFALCCKKNDFSKCFEFEFTHFNPVTPVLHLLIITEIPDLHNKESE